MSDPYLYRRRSETKRLRLRYHAADLDLQLHQVRKIESRRVWDHGLYSKYVGHNLSVRMTNRRYTRLTNAFSKKIENRSAAVALGYFAYNFIKIHRTLRCTACNGRRSDQSALEVSDLVALLEAQRGG